MQHWLRKTYDWMRLNKKWLFSGIGVIPIVVIFSFLKPMWTHDTDLPKGSDSPETVNKQVSSPIRLVDTLTPEGVTDSPRGSDSPKTLNKQVSSPIRLADTLTPEGVIEAVRGALPLQRENVARSYDGIKVSWKGAIRNMYKLPGHGDTNLVRIFLCADTSRCSKRIKFKVNADDYPGLELLREGDSVLVKGEIAGVGGSSVVLRNAKISF